MGRRVAEERSRRRGGFTLVELLVAMLIILILAGITLATVNVAANGDRIPGGGRQTQSMLEGARDRAIYAGEPRGVRLVLDPNNPNVVSSFVFVGAPEPYGKGTVTVFQDPPTTGPWYVVEDDPQKSSWGRMAQRRLLQAGARITFGGDEGNWYRLQATPALAPMGTPGASGRGEFRAQLSGDFEGQPPGQQFYTGLSYNVELAPSVLPNEEPRQMPRGVVVDLESSRLEGKIPSAWHNDNGTPAPADDFYIPELDIVFSPQGTIAGSLAAQGVLHLVVADGVDMQTGFRSTHGNAGTTDINGDGTPDERVLTEAIVSVFTSSGTVIVSSPDETDADSDNVRDDPWYLAEVGGEG